MKKATHYLVVRSPHAEGLALGFKSLEFRSWSNSLQFKTVAVAVARKQASEAEILEFEKDWKLNKFEKKELRDLIAKNNLGKIIGEIEFGLSYGDHVEVEESKLWDKFKPHKGGLGLRPIE